MPSTNIDHRSWNPVAFFLLLHLSAFLQVTLDFFLFAFFYFPYSIVLSVGSLNVGCLGSNGASGRFKWVTTNMTTNWFIHFEIIHISTFHIRASLCSVVLMACCGQVWCHPDPQCQCCWQLFPCVHPGNILRIVRKWAESIYKGTVYIVIMLNNLQ